MSLQNKLFIICCHGAARSTGKPLLKGWPAKKSSMTEINMFTEQFEDPRVVYYLLSTHSHCSLRVRHMTPSLLICHATWNIPVSLNQLCLLLTVTLTGTILYCGVQLMHSPRHQALTLLLGTPAPQAQLYYTFMSDCLGHQHHSCSTHS